MAKKLRLFLILSLALSALTACATHETVVVRTARPGWTLLGERTVDGNYDHDVIEVGGSAGRFHQLMLTVEHHGIEMFDVKVVFGDGERFDVPTRLHFSPDTRSAVIDLPGGERYIRRIEFRYGNVPGRGRARLEA